MGIGGAAGVRSGPRSIVASAEPPLSRLESILLTGFCALPSVVSWIVVLVFWSQEFESSAGQLFSAWVLVLGLIALLVPGLLLTWVAAWVRISRRRVLLVFLINTSFWIFALASDPIFAATTSV